MTQAQRPRSDQPLPESDAPGARLHERIHDLLKRDLMTGRFAPGQRLPLRALAGSMGTSLIPVRDALQRLESLGVVVSTPGRTMMVPLLSPAQEADITRLRLLLEGETAEAAARHRKDADLAVLGGFCDQIETAGIAGDLDLFLQANFGFHMALAAASRIAFVGQLLEPLWMHLGPQVRQTMPRPADIRHALAFHQAILQAVAAGDARAARAAMVADILESDLP